MGLQLWVWGERFVSIAGSPHCTLFFPPTSLEWGHIQLQRGPAFAQIEPEHTGSRKAKGAGYGAELSSDNEEQRRGCCPNLRGSEISRQQVISLQSLERYSRTNAGEKRCWQAEGRSQGVLGCAEGKGVHPHRGGEQRDRPHCGSCRAAACIPAEQPMSIPCSHPELP